MPPVLGCIGVGGRLPPTVNEDCPDHGVWPGGQWAGTSLNQLSKKRVHFRRCGTLCWPAGSPSMSRTSPWTPPPLTSSGTGWTGSTLTSGKSSPTARTWTADQGKERLEEVLDGPDSRGIIDVAARDQGRSARIMSGRPEAATRETGLFWAILAGENSMPKPPPLREGCGGR